VPLGLFAVSIPDALRPRAFGINAAMWGVSALVGPLLGAVLWPVLSWILLMPQRRLEREQVL